MHKPTELTFWRADFLEDHLIFRLASKANLASAIREMKRLDTSKQWKTGFMLWRQEKVFSTVKKGRGIDLYEKK